MPQKENREERRSSMFNCCAVRKPGSRVMKLINKGALVCAARCCAAVPGCPWIFHEAESGEVCCLEHLVESTGTLVARKLQLQEGRREKMPIKMKGGEQQQSASLRIIWLICFANLILRLPAPARTKQTQQWMTSSQQNKFNASPGSPPPPLAMCLIKYIFQNAKPHLRHVCILTNLHSNCQVSL